MSDLIDLDPASTDPPYEQLRARISELARRSSSGSEPSGSPPQPTQDRLAPISAAP